MILDAATRKLEILLGGAVTTNQLPFQCEWVDVTTTTSTPGTNGGTSNGATPVDLVPAPGASTQRIINGINIYNADTVPQTVTVRFNDNATTRVLKSTTLSVGDTLTWSLGDSWEIIDSSGNVHTTPSSGNWLKRTVLTTGTSFVTQLGTHSISIRMVGGGGGGGGNTSVASAASAAGGGGGGAYAEKTFAVNPLTAYTYAIGGAGAGNSGAAGGNGGSTTFAVGATTVTAPGGTGGPAAVSATTLKAYLGGAGGTIATNGDLNSTGTPGLPGVILIVSGSIGVSGKGADSQFGSGGIPVIVAGAGAAGTGFGAGGSGGLTAASAARAGGAGTAGCIIVDEYA